MGTEIADGRGISSSSIEHLRSILISSLPQENVGLQDRKRFELFKKVRFNYIAGSRSSSAAKDDPKARLKTVKDRQYEERKKKLEEMQEQAMALQRFKEKKETERKVRMSELKQREEVKRQLVEDRKKAINDAERDRLESILKRNQEREARIEAKRRNERHSIVFAFGSSTPRMLQPTDSVGSFWGHRRATSTQNITTAAAPLTRRQSERELDGGIKKRATSAGGLERSVEDMRLSTSMYEILNWGHGSTTPTENSIPSFPTNTDPPGVTANIATTPQAAAGCASGYVGRRRTDLMPTIPSREPQSASSRKSFTRSPGRAYSMSRLDQLAKPRKRPELPSLAETTNPSSFRPLNRPQQSSVSRSMSHLAVSKAGPQAQRPLRKCDSRSMHQLYAASPLPPPRTTRATQLRHQKLASASHEAPSRPSSSLSQQSTSSVTSSVNMRTRPIAAPRRPRPVSIAVTGISNDLKNGMAEMKKSETKPPLPKTRKSSLVKSTEKLQKKKSATSPTEGSPKLLVSPTINAVPVAHSPVDNKFIVKEKKTITTVTNETENVVQEVQKTIKVEEDVEVSKEKEVEVVETITSEHMDSKPSTSVQLEELVSAKEEEEQAKTPTAEIEPEVEAPKKIDVQAEAERVEVAEILAETESTGTEHRVEEVQKTAEPPAEPVKTIEKSEAEKKGDISSSILTGELSDSVTDMSASMTKVRINTEEEAKAALAERRRLAREEAERQAEMERRRIEEEQRLEFERQQREEEQQRILIEKLRAEEQQRLEEAIKEAQKREEEERLRREEDVRMKLLKEEAERRAREEAERQKAELQERLKNEEKEREARRKRVEAIMLRTRGRNSGATTQQNEEKINSDDNKSDKINGSKVDASENGHKNGKEIDTVDNIIPVETLKNANTVNNVDNLSTDDTLNSNNAWQHNTSVDVGRHF